jgi:hypothetical protein
MAILRTLSYMGYAKIPKTRRVFSEQGVDEFSPLQPTAVDALRLLTASFYVVKFQVHESLQPG